MAQQQGATRERQNIKVKEPQFYIVRMHNDDFTTMDFVVKVLTDIFFKSEADANAIMLLIHKTGSAVVGNYPLDIALSKTAKARHAAAQEGFPLKITVEQE